jgi:hypothetical protein
MQRVKTLTHQAYCNMSLKGAKLKKNFKEVKLGKIMAIIGIPT